MDPLASRIRPTTLDNFVGQEHLVGADKPLRRAIEQKHLFSFILWGPPGVGKTTLARIYAHALGAQFHELSAVSAGKADVRNIIQASEQDQQSHILFLDEIHRFNKAQQDFLLPYVESGIITLIGATTENPSFEVISALLSRSKVFMLYSLEATQMQQVLKHTGIKMKKDARDFLIQIADGDARQMLTLLENTHTLYNEVTVEHLTQALQDKRLRYDKGGEEHYNTISAFIKSMRASQPDAAVYYLARMLASGEDPKFIARRMVIFASEDIGQAQPTALVVANEVFRAVETVGLPEADLNLAQGTIYLANALKDRATHDALRAAQADVQQYGNVDIPMVIRNAPTKLMKNLGYGKGYERYTKEDLLPETLNGRVYYQAKKK